MQIENLTPNISVILPVYNGALYLKESINSILNQTYTNFEFIILNDGSTDNSEEIILSYSDKRIKYYKHTNCGLAATLNLGLNLALGTYIARQDQDDISHKTRFEKQVDFLENNLEINLLGTRAKIFENNSSDVRFHKHATHPADLKFDLLFNNPFVHSSVMFKKTIIQNIGNYITDRNLYEDYNLWSRIAVNSSVANLSEVLVDYRHHNEGLSKNISNFKEYALYNQGVENLKKIFGLHEQHFCDLIALYHWKKNIFKGSSNKQLKNALDVISQKIIELYPSHKYLTLLRKKQYLKIIRYRQIVLKMRADNITQLKLLYLKIVIKLLGLHSEVKNK